MKKKILAVLLCVLILAITFTACNNDVYEQPAVGGAELDKPVEGNGGLVVRQGKHIYFVNGHVGVDANNDFGVPFKSCIMRAELDADGKIIKDSQKVIVPKNIYSKSTMSGIYIYDGWIYYATPNTEKDRSGNINTTHLDFMRTKVDATRTELLHTLDNREVDFKFNKGRLTYFQQGKIMTIDLTAKKTNEVENRATLLDRVQSNKFINADNEFGNFIVVTRTLPEDINYKTYNELCFISSTGELKTIISEKTYTDDEKDFQNIFKIAVKDYLIEDDGLTLYYTKSNTVGGTQNLLGLFCYKFTDTNFEFDPKNEKQLTYNDVSKLYPIGYEEGILIVNSNNVVLAKFDENGKPVGLSLDEKLIINKGVEIKTIKDGYVYYTASSEAKALFRYKLDGTLNEQKVCDFAPLTSWVGMDICDNYIYYLDSESNYLYRVELKENAEPELVGKMTEEDYAKYIEEDKEDEE